MKFLLDESADARLASFLRANGHDVSAIAVDHPASLADAEVLAIAFREDRILIAADRDFGELVFARGRPHAGVLLFRLGRTASLAVKTERLAHALSHYATQLDQFLVVTRDRVRVRQADAPSRA